MLAGVVPQQSLLVLPGEGAVRRGASVGSAVRKYFVDSFFEVFHNQVVLLFAVLVLRLGLEAAQLAGVSRSEAVHVLGQAPAEVQHCKKGFGRNLKS